MTVAVRVGAYNVVGPTGGDDTAMLASALAASASRPVMLSFGQYDVRKPLFMPDGGVIVGAGERNLSDYYQASINPSINLVLNPAGAWQDGQAGITMGNWSRIGNFAITGMKLTAGHKAINGVNLGNHDSPIVEDIWASLCYNGIFAGSDGSLSDGSPWGSSCIFAIIRRCWLIFSEAWGLEAYGINGGGFSDAEISGCEFAASAGLFIGSGAGNLRISNSRFEDDGDGLWIQNTGAIIVSGCQFDRLVRPIVIEHAGACSVTGCLSSSAGNTGGGSGGDGNHVSFVGFDSTGIEFAGNCYNKGAADTAYTYWCDAATHVTGAFCESGSGDLNTGLYRDAHTEAAIAPSRVKLGL